mmetsp:Transcript_17900/g.38052  ORF Transcript_17900/g.38052 Transcript_17900/m.38052 type:complete len:246 (+) Transcript_17900:790-1527(+)
MALELLRVPPAEVGPREVDRGGDPDLRQAGCLVRGDAYTLEEEKQDRANAKDAVNVQPIHLKQRFRLDIAPSCSVARPIDSRRRPASQEASLRSADARKGHKQHGCCRRGHGSGVTARLRRGCNPRGIRFRGLRYAGTGRTPARRRNKAQARSCRERGDPILPRLPPAMANNCRRDSKGQGRQEDQKPPTPPRGGNKPPVRTPHPLGAGKKAARIPANPGQHGPGCWEWDQKAKEGIWKQRCGRS